MRRTARQQAPGSPDEFRMFWRDDVHRARPRRARPGPPPADVAGPPQPPAAAGRRRAARRRCGARCAASAAASAVARRSTTRCSSDQAFLDFVLAWWPPLDAPTVLGWLRDPEFLARVAEGVLSPEEQRLLHQVVGAATSRSAVGRGRAAARRAALRARRRAGAHRGRARRSTTAARGRGRHAGADDRRRTASTRRPAAPGRRPPTGSRTTPSRTCSSTRPRTSRRCSGGWSAGAAAPRRGRSSATRRSRRGRIPEESAAARADALEGKELHEFHLSTNYRNSSEIYEYAAAYAERVGLDADLPTAVRSTGVEPRGDHRRRRPRGGHPRRRSPTSPARSAARSASWCRSPAAPRSTPGWRRGPSSPTTPPAPGRPSTPRSRPSGEDRIVVLTGLDTKGLEFDGIVVVRPAGDRGRVGHRPVHALRRPHPRHPAAHHHQLTRSPVG